MSLSTRLRSENKSVSRHLSKRTIAVWTRLFETPPPPLPLLLRPSLCAVYRLHLIKGTDWKYIKTILYSALDMVRVWYMTAQQVSNVGKIFTATTSWTMTRCSQSGRKWPCSRVPILLLCTSSKYSCLGVHFLHFSVFVIKQQRCPHQVFVTTQQSTKSIFIKHADVIY